jgi:hypothetical protein
MADDAGIVYTLFCPCGGTIRVSGKASGAKRCPMCRDYVRFEVEVDPKTFQKSVVVKGKVEPPPGAAARKDDPKDAPRSEEEKDDGTIRRYARVQGFREPGSIALSCACGTEIWLARGGLSGQIVCNWCEAKFNLGERPEMEAHRRPTKEKTKWEPVPLPGRVEKDLCKVTCPCGQKLGFELAHRKGVRTCPLCGTPFTVTLPGDDPA